MHHNMSCWCELRFTTVLPVLVFNAILLSNWTIFIVVTGHDDVTESVELSSGEWLGKKSGIISSVGQWQICTSFLLTQSVMKKYHTFMYLTPLPIDPHLLFLRRMELILPWCMMTGVIGYPCSNKEYDVHKIIGCVSCTATTSALVELFVFSFCFVEVIHSV